MWGDQRIECHAGDIAHLGPCGTPRVVTRSYSGASAIVDLSLQPDRGISGLTIPYFHLGGGVTLGDVLHCSDDL